jgi:hypothetical protein
MACDPNRETVNHPAHYDIGNGLQIIDVIEGLGLDFPLGSAMKYIARAGRKGDRLEDVKKAVWCLRRVIERAEAGPAPATERVLRAVRDERGRQERLRAAGKFTHTAASPGVTDAACFAMFMEEVGEIATAMLAAGVDGAQAHDAKGQDLDAELDQAAAVLVAWREGRIARGGDA